MELFEKFTERIAGTILAIVFTVYSAGFVMVNAYLSKFHIVQVEFFQPAFVSAGLLFVIIAIVTSTPAIPIADGMKEVFDIFIKTNIHIASISEDVEKTKARPKLRAYFVNILQFILKISVLFLLFFLIEWIVGNGVAWVASLASRSAVDKLRPEIAQSFIFVAQVEGLAFLAMVLVFQNWKKINRVTRDMSIFLSGALFLFAQTYSLLIIANNVYEKLPTNIGGGEPEYVTFYVTRETGMLLASLDDTFEDSDAIIQISSDATSPDLLSTQPLVLFWQLKSVNIQGDSNQDLYYFRPARCPNCPIIKIHEADIFVVIYGSKINSEP